MPGIIIEKPQTESDMNILTDDENAIAGRIRERAFELFEKSGEARGNDSQNWIKAEEELLQVPHWKLAEKDGSFSLHISILGHHLHELKLIVLRDALILTGQPTHRHSKNHLAAVSAKRIFQRFDLPASIDTDSVHATFENGLLKVTAVKLGKPKTNAAPTAA